MESYLATLFLLALPAAPIAMTSSLILGPDRWDNIQKQFYDMGFLGREFINPTLPIFNLLLIYYIHKYRPELSKSFFPTILLYIMTIYQFIMQFYCEYMVSNYCLRIDLVPIGIVLWSIIIYLIITGRK